MLEDVNVLTTLLVKYQTTLIPKQLPLLSSFCPLNTVVIKYILARNPHRFILDLHTLRGKNMLVRKLLKKNFPCFLVLYLTIYTGINFMYFERIS